MTSGAGTTKLIGKPRDIGVWLSNTFTIEFRICLVYMKHDFFLWLFSTYLAEDACMDPLFNIWLNPQQCMWKTANNMACFMCTGQTKNFLLWLWVLELNPGPLVHACDCQWSVQGQWSDLNEGAFV